MRDQNLGVGDLERVLEIAALGGEVERRVHAADSVRAEPGADDIGPGGNPDRDVVTDLDADLLQCVARAPRLPGGFAVRPLLVFEDEIRLVGRRRPPAPRADPGRRTPRGSETGVGTRAQDSSAWQTELKSLKLIASERSCQPDLMSDVEQIPIPVPYLGSVNLWLLEGDPLTLVDAGPANSAALTALEKGLAEHGFALADIEQVLLTHHHLDHAGLARDDQGALGSNGRRAPRDGGVGRGLSRTGAG